MKKFVYYIPFVIAFMFIFINEQTICTRIAFAMVGLISLGITINETIKLKRSNTE